MFCSSSWLLVKIPLIFSKNIGVFQRAVKFPLQNYSDCAPRARSSLTQWDNPGLKQHFHPVYVLKRGTCFFFLLFAFCKERQSSPLIHVRADHGHSSPTANTTRLSGDAGGLLDEGKFVQVTLSLRGISAPQSHLWRWIGGFWIFWIPWDGSYSMNIHYRYIFVIGFRWWFDCFENGF